MPATPPSERRDYFRIEDLIGLEYRRYKPSQNVPADPFGDGHLDGLKAELRKLDTDVRNHLASLSEKDRLLTTLLKSLNGKVDTLARIMAFEQNPLQPEDWQEVTLSEGGIAFVAPDNALTVGDAIALRMTLPPELYRPQALARVIDSQPCGSGGTRVHAEFTDIHDLARQHIARHVMRWQIRQRQQQGESS
ncbi:PilZ domain-containing protein [Marinobacter caseinilyticus]|uniref:PilZ domain-containing protein n=1 Tax=Marinobacter caseinilyticus TaxID=2692195 RepID=UPI00140A2A71|nr:PilZ domain-containing protein [Marinobacter caseinilyticus]